MSLELTALDGSNGFALQGGAAGDEAGYSVSAAGDLNGDGLDDFAVGAPFASPVANASGSVYIVFGNAQGLPNPLVLSGLNGTNGFVINGQAAFDLAGTSVDAAGDVNGDGFDDLVIGAPGTSPGVDYAGAAYVLFGTNQGFPNPLALSALDGTNGFAINGSTPYAETATSVGGVGDFNGDGMDDVIVGAPFAGAGAGRSYVVFGANGPWPAAISVGDLDGSNGVVITGVLDGDSSGTAVSRAGDVNADGIADIVIGAPLAGPVGANPGAAYVVFGTDQGFTTPFGLGSLNGINGFRMVGVSLGDDFGDSVDSAGDLNGDGIADVVVGAPGADPNGSESGASYVVFGSNIGFSNPLNVSDLDGSNGAVLSGVSGGDQSGAAVSGIGDLNADGRADIIIGAPGSDPNGVDAGAGYVVFGSSQAWASPLNLAVLNGANGFVIRGASAGDGAGMAVAGAGDINSDGRADLAIAAPKADASGPGSGVAYVVYGLEHGGDDVIFSDGFE